MNSLDLPTHFLSFFSGGTLKIAYNDIQSINFISTQNTLIIDILDIPIKISKKPGIIKQLTGAKNFAKKLKQENHTLEIRLKGDPILKLGANANPKLAKIVTLSNNIEIINLKKLKNLAEVF